MTERLPKAPLTVNWALNNSCTFRCRHCYSRADSGDELPGAVVRECIAKVARFGVLSVNFGGGEPLLRPDLLELAAYARSCGLAVSMNSNGYLLDQLTAQAMRQAGFARVGISIDSHRPEVHDAFRGVPGSHQRAVAALGFLAEAGLGTSISTVISTINHDDIDELIAFARGHGARQINFHNFKCSGLGFANRNELDLSPDQWRDFYARALAAKESCSDLEISLDDPIIALLGVKGGSDSLVKGSVCGKLSLNIKANGDITPCGFIPIVIGNVVNDDLAGLWRNSPVLARLRHKTATGKCAGCGHYEECLGGCSARALALTGDVNSPDPHCWAD